HQVRALDRELPLQPEVALAARIRVRRDERDEQRALADLLADRRVPGVPAAELVLVEPHHEPGAAQRVADAPGALRVLRGVAQENGSRGAAPPPPPQYHSVSFPRA